ncbi:hypothetical protein FKW77_000680 [Venturia effusa]|uniref:Uncharacterized protein n=1 Tax=Venturia effusa TaxID=50376 RepID=A0A517LRD2_9PEZI|nr:hypothetical protein FKW77_000680 [Venturia effusa]
MLVWLQRPICGMLTTLDLSQCFPLPASKTSPQVVKTFWITTSHNFILVASLLVLLYCPVLFTIYYYIPKSLSKCHEAKNAAASQVVTEDWMSTQLEGMDTNEAIDGLKNYVKNFCNIAQDAHDTVGGHCISVTNFRAYIDDLNKAIESSDQLVHESTLADFRADVQNIIRNMQDAYFRALDYKRVCTDVKDHLHETRATFDALILECKTLQDKVDNGLVLPPGSRDGTQITPSLIFDRVDALHKRHDNDIIVLTNHLKAIDDRLQGGQAMSNIITQNATTLKNEYATHKESTQSSGLLEVKEDFQQTRELLGQKNGNVIVHVDQENNFKDVSVTDMTAVLTLLQLSNNDIGKVNLDSTSRMLVPISARSLAYGDAGMLSNNEVETITTFTLVDIPQRVLDRNTQLQHIRPRPVEQVQPSKHQSALTTKYITRQEEYATKVEANVASVWHGERQSSKRNVKDLEDGANNRQGNSEFQRSKDEANKRQGNPEDAPIETLRDEYPKMSLREFESIFHHLKKIANSETIGISRLDQSKSRVEARSRIFATLQDRMTAASPAYYGHPDVKGSSISTPDIEIFSGISNDLDRIANRPEPKIELYEDPEGPIFEFPPSPNFSRKDPTEVLAIVSKGIPGFPIALHSWIKASLKSPNFDRDPDSGLVFSCDNGHYLWWIAEAFLSMKEFTDAQRAQGKKLKTLNHELQREIESINQKLDLDRKLALQAQGEKLGILNLELQREIENIDQELDLDRKLLLMADRFMRSIQPTSNSKDKQDSFRMENESDIDAATLETVAHFVLGLHKTRVDWEHEKAELKKCLSEQGERNSASEQKIDELKKAHAELEHKNAQLSTSCAELKQKNAQLSTSCAKFEQQNARLSTSIGVTPLHWANKIQEYIDENASLKKYCDKMEDENTELSDKVAELSDKVEHDNTELKERLAKVISTAEIDRAAFEHETDGLKQTYAKSKHKNNELEKSLSEQCERSLDLEQEIVGLKKSCAAKLEDKNIELSELNLHLSKAHSTAEIDREASKQEIDGLKKTCAKLKYENEALSNFCSEQCEQVL